MLLYNLRKLCDRKLNAPTWSQWKDEDERLLVFQHCRDGYTFMLLFQHMLANEHLREIKERISEPIGCCPWGLDSNQHRVFLSCSSWTRIYFPPRQPFSHLYAPFRIHLPSSSFKFYFYSNSFVLGAIFEKSLSFFTESQIWFSPTVLFWWIFISDVKFHCVSFCWVSWCIGHSRVRLLCFMWMVIVSVGRTSPSEWALSGWVQDTQNQDDRLSISGLSMILNAQSENLWNSLPILICWPLFLEMIFLLPICHFTYGRTWINRMTSEMIPDIYAIICA